MENLKKYRKSGLEHFLKFVRELPVLSPKRIYERLGDLGYRGQNEARKGVALDVQWLLNQMNYSRCFGTYDNPSVWRPYTIHW